MEEKLLELIEKTIEKVNKKEEKATLTIQEASELTGIGRDKLLELAHGNSSFPAFKVGTKFLINRELLHEWLKKIAVEKIVL